MAAQTHELLDAPPPAIARPHTLVGPHAYAATWLYLRTTDAPAASPPPPALSAAAGELPPPDRAPDPPDRDPPERSAEQPAPSPPPTSRVSRRLFVVRDDGRLFGPVADAP